MLRHKIHFDGFDAVDRSVEKRDVIPKFKTPVKVEYARGGDMENLVALINAHSLISLSAAVGAGKSTKIPLELSRALGKLVVHTVPFHIAARSLADYLAKVEQSDRVVYVDDLAADLPSHGVVLTTNAYLAARLVRDKLAGVEDAVLYLDEVHESDASTAVIRSVAPMLTMFSTVVRATATADPGQAIPARMPGTRETRKFTHVDLKSWSAHDRGQPWSASAIGGNVALAVERPDVRQRLKDEYTEHGFNVRELVSSTTYEYYCETLRMLKSSRSGIVVLLCDYSFRSSLSIPGLSVVIEGGEVAVPTVVDGAPVIKYRPTYDFEVQQFFGRAGRFPGDRVVLWKSTNPSPTYMCDLEELEADAANLLYRLLGYRPPLDLGAFEFFHGKVPINLAATFTSDHPARLCPDESRVDWINGDKAFEAEKLKARYAYLPGRAISPRDRRKYASVHTVVDETRVPSPPPAVPDKYVVSSVDVAALEAVYRERSVSPSSRTVMTLESNSVDDALSIFSNDMAFVKPKRIAKRVQDERDAAAAAEAKRVAEEMEAARAVVVSQPEVVVAPVPKRSATQLRKPSELAAVFASAENSPVTAPTGVHEHVLGLQAGVPVSSLSEEQVGAYVYYHGMDKAPESSVTFWRGLDSILQFAERDRGGTVSRGLHASDRMFAMRALVDEYNNSVAVAMGVQRLFAELAKRPPSDWSGLLDSGEMVRVVDWITNESNIAQARARLCNSLMPRFMDYELDKIPGALELEQCVMSQMMDKFAEATVKKDPEKITEYLQMLNGRNIRIGPDRRKLLR